MSVLGEIERLTDELCNPHDHFEALYETTAHRNKKWKGVHRTVVPGLIEQLEQLIFYAPVTGISEFTSGKSFESKVPINVEALDRYEMIERDVREWVSFLSLPCDLSVVGSVASLGKYGPDLDSALATELAASLRAWRSLAQGLVAYV